MPGHYYFFEKLKILGKNPHKLNCSYGKVPHALKNGFSQKWFEFFFKIVVCCCLAEKNNYLISYHRFLYFPLFREKITLFPLFELILRFDPQTIQILGLQINLHISAVLQAVCDFFLGKIHN